MEFTGERFIPESASKEMEIEHLQRYYSILEHVKDKVVIDAACGEGYGSFMISRHARQVYGIDISDEAIVSAKLRYRGINLVFDVGSIHELPYPDKVADVFVSFETIEHVSEEIQQQFMNEIKRVLKDDGILIMSTPDKYEYSDVTGYQNPFHVKEFYKSEFYLYLQQRFENIEIYYQKMEIFSVIGNSISDKYRSINSGMGGRMNAAINNGKYLISICSDSNIDHVKLDSLCLSEESTYHKLIDRIVELQNDVDERNLHIKKLDIQISEKDEMIRIFQEKIQIHEQWMQNDNEILEKMEAQHEQIRNDLIDNHKLKVIEHSLELTRNELEKVKRDLIESTFELEKKDKELEITKENLQAVNDELEATKENLQVVNVELETTKGNLQVVNVELATTREDLQTTDGVLLETKTNLSDQSDLINKYIQEIHNKEGHIQLLLESDRKLQHITGSNGWNLLLRYYKTRDFMIPLGSKRRLLMKLLYIFVKNPKFLLQKLSKKNIKKLNYYLKTEDLGRVESRLETFIERHEEVEFKPLQVIQGHETTERLTFPICSKPLVSIVIPVYNQWHYTYHCLVSILKNTHNIPYEVIIADDVSTDETQNIQQVVENIVVVRDEVNRGFLLNCNNAAKHAKGKYIFFLNNDTNVQPEWLQSLLNLIEHDDTIGMVGSKLVYPDGRLQEAGGIIWNDASGWNYGRLDDPEKSEYNYVKEVDYISGAAIMIRTDLWKEIGGFDERYTPAYNEDSDLAFEVRSRGYRLVYQPQSVIVHFEGVSHGTDTEKGMKSYQEKNVQKFKEKWQETLEKNHSNNARNVFLARERSFDKKTILIIDHYVPHFDKDAGSRTILQYIKLFIEKGMNVKFIGDNYFKHEPYTSFLQQIGVEVLYGNWYANHLEEWLKQNGKYFHYVLLNRPHISIRYIDKIRELTSAKIIYYGHDLHYLRELREYELTSNPALLKSSNDWKSIEQELFSKSDVVYYPSQIEINEIVKENPAIIARAIPAYIYRINQDYLCNDFTNRNHLLFVGGFGHKPNIDAVLWFVNDIFPSVREHLPDVKFYIVGSNPPDIIKQLSSERVIVTGFVEDHELEDFYYNCKIVIVPLRFGAGVKGKVVEAMYHGMPIVTTSIGAEGLIDAENILVETDHPNDFAERIISLYSNSSMLQKLSLESKQYVKEFFSAERVLEVVSHDIVMSEVMLRDN